MPRFVKQYFVMFFEDVQKKYVICLQESKNINFLFLCLNSGRMRYVYQKLEQL